MTTGQLELPLFSETAVRHSALLTWSPVGGGDGTYTTTCDCDGIPVLTHSWEEQGAVFLAHCEQR